MIAAIMRQVNSLDPHEMDEKELAVLVEMNQRYLEFLDELQDRATVTDEGITVMVEDTKIKFTSIEDVAQWMTSIK